ncbi:23S rRNA (adenine(2503)-C(2))-methyltransferase RlmN [Spirilliplanes yamanashiensis]|uniref:Probable dual-specificity RNA methyltransferase RlmN n=1 Tax=Spirilliplanes yamanashiensis TaxID=42233 RepID=A0A8J4DHF3_9ACTN|nr:23S rRNA (adenine(2503)-C(2))-methyltransferase RlmN [Spirilliplanes yamanashiensis]MDP9819681.1 23S rRNA (adenine2503-C2)-methyltransferase [Spirilliplanes yamanashiensis]GIJ01499.1 putative dual-specificity RNA methyltransferase RlmN [Spirilliplanes yamanashiensis]
MTMLPVIPTSPDTPDAVATRRRPAMPPRHLADLDLAGRRAAAAELGEPAFRAAQLSQHYFGRFERDVERMTDLPAKTRDALGERLMPRLLTSVKELSCDDGATRKSLWRLHDGAMVESVLMGYPDRITACVSSQAGCGMACPFCATGQAGLTRNLSVAEIVDQVVHLAGVAASGAVTGSPPRLSRIVFMGMGEPLANYPRVIEAVRRLTTPAPEGLGLSQRHITVSTVGLVPAMRRLIAEDLSVTLALSLHAPDDDLRDELVPVNQRWKVDEVLDVAFEYAARTGRRVSIEYALIRDVNDQPWRADLLGRRLAGKLAHVNLIPLNPTPGSRWDASPKPAEREFVRRLRAAGVATTVRDTRGREIDGACGQLAASELTDVGAVGGADGGRPAVPGAGAAEVAQ